MMRWFLAGLASVGLLAIIKPLVSAGPSTVIADASGGTGGQVLTAAAKSTPQNAVAAAQAKNMSFMLIPSTASYAFLI